MAKLPARQKVSVLCYRRAGADEILVVPREVRRALVWGLPSAEAAPGEAAADVAKRVATGLAAGAPVAHVDLGLSATYRVSDGPRAGEWTERFHAVEMPPGARAREGTWFAHYDAKARAGADAPRVREAFARLRELARLKP